MCPHCRAFITEKDRICPYCKEQVGPRAIDRRSPADVLGWVQHHHSEHIHQVMDLRSAWASTQT